jgi:iron complex transport system substrate-binding protein
MAQWKARYGGNEQSSQVLNTMPRDDLNRVVELRAVPKRVLVIGPGATEIVFALGQQAKVAGRDSASDFPADKMENIAVVGDFNGPNIERAVAANPDFVIVQGETYGRDRVDSWQKQIGVPVASVAATTVQGVAQDIRKIGAWLGASDKAETIAARLQNQGSTAAKNSAKGAPTAIVEIQRSPLMVAGRGTLIDDVLNRAGFANGAKVEGYKQLNLENLLANPPDFYVVPSDTLKNAPDVKLKLVSERNRVLDSLRQTPGLKNLECVRRGRVLLVPADWVLRPSPRLADGVAEMTRQRLQLGTKK